MLPTACFNLKRQVWLGIQALSLHPCQCSSMPISIRAHSIPHFHHPLLCACVCRTVGLIRPPHLHEGQADSTAARPRKQTGAEQNVGTPFLPMQPDPLHRGERCSEDWGTPPHRYDKHTSRKRKHTQSLCASDGCHSQLIQVSEHILPSIAQESRL